MRMQKKIPLLPGVEFSTTFYNQSVHLLAYAFQLEHPELHSFCNIHHERRLKRFKQIISKLNKEGVAVTLDDVLQLLEGQNYSVLGRPHLAQVLVNKGIVPSIQAAFKTYLGTNLPGYVPSDAFSIEETLELIRAVKGKAILAHPHIYSNRKLITSLLALPLDGIEGYYGRFHPNQEQKWLTIAQEKNWLVTGGSDYHGTVKPHLMLGCSWTGEEVFQTLYQHYLQVNNTDESRDFKTS